MTAFAELMPLLAEWRQLTECETQAILENDWKAVAEQQRLKERLVREMTRVRARLAPDPQAGEAPLQDQQRRLGGIVSELIALEMRNRDSLSAMRQARQAELARLNQTTQNLRGLRRTYGAPVRQAWQSYS
jgi:hypothetical protein